MKRVPGMTTVSAAAVALAVLAALAPAPRAFGQRYLSERVIKGVKVQATALKIQTGFVAQLTAPNELTIRKADDPKSVEGKLECACEAAKPATACAIKVVDDGIVCGGKGCTDATCKVRAATGYKLP